MNFFKNSPWRFSRRVIRNPTSGAWDADPQFVDTQAAPPAGETLDLGAIVGEESVRDPNNLATFILAVSYDATGAVIPMFTSALLALFDPIMLVVNRNPDDNGGAAYPSLDTPLVCGGNGGISMFAGYPVPFEFATSTLYSQRGLRIFPRFGGVSADDAAVDFMDVYLAVT